MASSRCVNLMNNNYFVTFIGTSLTSLGLTLIILHTRIPEYFFSLSFVLKQNYPILDMWLKNPMELNTDFYFFNWTNPEEFTNPETKPKFKQVGPYRYKLNVEKVNVTWNDNNTLTYNQLRTWDFNEEYKDVCNNDNITTLNAVPMIASHSIRNWSYFMKTTVSMMMSGIHVTNTPNKLLFDGLSDTIINLQQTLPYFATEFPPIDRFGWFRLVNGSSTYEGVYNAANGIGGNFEMLNWNYDSHSSNFDRPCSKVHGSPGEFFNGKITKDYIGYFAALLCRYVKIDYEKEEIVDGILGYKYSIGSGSLDNGTTIKGNDCYCSGECIPSGMVNISSCRYGMPLFASLPHYYAADPVYVNSVEGLEPEKQKHETYVILEPKTGVPLKAVVRFQMNMLVYPVKGIWLLRDVPRIFFPVVWLEQKVTIPNTMSRILNIYLIGPYVLMGIGITLLVLGISIIIFKIIKPKVFEFVNNTKKIETHFKQFQLEEVPLQYKAEVN